VNENCETILISKIKHFVSRKAINIEGLGIEIIKTLFKNNLLFDASSLYELKNNQKEILNLEGFKEKLVGNLITAIEDSKNNDLYRFIFGLGIRHVGEKVSKILAKRFSNINELANTTVDHLIKIKDLGPKVSKSLVL
jgi:DNA ligase (NAD+)